MIDWSNCLPYKSFQKQPFCKIYTILMLNWCHKRYWFYNIFKKFTVLTIILLDLCSLYYVTLKPICSKFSIQSSVFFYSQLFYFRKDNRNVYFSFHRLENQGCILFICTCQCGWNLSKKLVWTVFVDPFHLMTAR